MSVAPDPRPLICLECGAANRPDGHVCKSCRTPLHSGAAVPRRRASDGRRDRPPLFWAYLVFTLVAIGGLTLGEAWLAGVNPALLAVGSIVILPVVLTSAGFAASWADRHGTTSSSPWVRRFLLALLIAIPVAFVLAAATAVAIVAMLFAICTVAMR